MTRLLNRRDSIKTGLRTASSVVALGWINSPAVSYSAPPSSTFQLNYAPHFGMFQHSAGKDHIAQLEFAADQGFTAWEDNGMRQRSVAEQERIAQAMERLHLRMGVFVATAEMHKVTFAGRDQNAWDQVLEDMRDTVAVAKRVRAKWVTVVPGHYDKGLEWGYQTANCVELLRRCCDILEPHGVVMVLEPLNWWRNHQGVFLNKIPQAYQI